MKFRQLNALLLVATFAGFCPDVFAGSVYIDVDSDGTDDFKVALYEKNLSAGDCIVFVHGNTAPFQHYMGDVFKLAKKDGRCVIGFDLPGHGRTKNVSGYDLEANGSIEAFVSALTSVTDGLQDFVVAGWSLGGDVSLQAYDRGLLDEMAGLVMIGTPPVDSLGLVVDGNGDAISPFQLGTCANEVVTNSYNLVGPLSAMQLETLVSSYFESCDIPLPVFLNQSKKTDPKARGGIIPSILAGQVADEITILSQVTTPVLFGYGADEELVNPVFMDAVAANFIQRPTVATFDAGHAAYTEDAAGVYAAIVSFVDKL